MREQFKRPVPANEGKVIKWRAQEAARCRERRGSQYRCRSSLGLKGPHRDWTFTAPGPHHSVHLSPWLIVIPVLIPCVLGYPLFYLAENWWIWPFVILWHLSFVIFGFEFWSLLWRIWWDAPTSPGSVPCLHAKSSSNIYIHLFINLHPRIPPSPIDF